MKSFWGFLFLFFALGSFVLLFVFFTDETFAAPLSCDAWTGRCTGGKDCKNDRNSGGGGGCTPRCGTCTPPACPSGTNTTSRPNCVAPGTSCNRGTDGCGGQCGTITRSCWYLENAPAPNAPTGVEMKVNSEQGEIRCLIQDDVRIPAEFFESGEGFKGLGSINPRLSDAIRGLVPALRYQYTIQESLKPTSVDNLGKNPIIAGPTLLPENTRFRPEVLLEGNLYDIYVLANSVNRCEGSTNSPQICRSFKINHKPEVLSITPVSGVGEITYYSPNEDVSGRSSTEPMNRRGEEKFGCTTDNPKIFRVEFRDENGCGDLDRRFDTDSNICGGGITPNLSLRAVDKSRLPNEDVFAPNQPSDLEILDLQCNGNIAVAYFSLTFVGDENIDLEIQAKAIDVLGDTSGWVSGPDWSYDGFLPEIGTLDSSTVLSINEFELTGGFQDYIANLSGVRGMRLYMQLVEGEVLKGSSNYGNMTYKRLKSYVLQNDTEVILPELTETIVLNRDDILVLGEYDESSWYKVWDWMTIPSLSKNYSDYGFEDSVNIGINQDGTLHFKLETVDRACNYSTRDTYNDTDTGDFSSFMLGAAWISTRGGHVHSGGDIRLAIKNVFYGDVLQVLPNFISSEERTTLSTELLTSGESLSGFTRTITDDIFYPLLSYQKQLTHSWYEILVARAESRGYLEDSDRVSLVNGNFSPEAELSSNCSNERGHIYFVNGSMTVNPDYFSELSTANKLDGCIFIVKGDITIQEGTHQSRSGDKPAYDLIRGYFISDGEIDIEYSDGENELRDGLKVVGGLFATGGDKSIRLGRSFQLRDNFLYPVLIVFHDARYLELSREILGSAFGGTYVSDVGFKQ